MLLIMKDDTVFIGTSCGIYVLFRRLRKVVETGDASDQYYIDSQTEDGWQILDSKKKQYNEECYGEKPGYVREFKLQCLVEYKKRKDEKTKPSDLDYVEVNNHYAKHLELDKDKSIVIVLVKDTKNVNKIQKRRYILAARYDSVKGEVQTLQRVQLKSAEINETIQIRTFSIQKAVDDYSNPFEYKTRYIALLCYGKIHRARLKLTKVSCLKSNANKLKPTSWNWRGKHELVEFKKRIEFNADASLCHYMEYAGDFICLVLRRQYCVLNELGNMVFVSGKSYSMQDQSVFMNWDPLLETKDKLFEALVNVIGADKNIVDVNWSSTKVYSMGSL
jgi:hypothetical protein